MQNVVTRETEDGKSKDVTIFNEYTDMSGFVVREMLETANPEMAFQVGYLVIKPMRLPVYKYVMRKEDGKEVRKAIVAHHVDGDDIQKFHIHGNGRTKEDALTRASNKMLRADVAKGNTRETVAV